MTNENQTPQSIPERLNRPLSVGDVIEHPDLGAGQLLGGWAGYLEIEFPSGKKTFRGADSCHLIPSGPNGRWRLVTAERRAEVLDEARRLFREDFLRADAFFDETASAWISSEEYQGERSSFIKGWIEQMILRDQTGTDRVPDSEQIAAIGAVHGHYQVVARAGSGKTETLTDRAVFLQQHCGVSPNEMLLLAFNRKAANEMVARVVAKLGGESVPHVMTFHALAYALVHPENDLLADAADGIDQRLSREIQRVIDDRLRNDAFRNRVRRLMLAHFRADWDRIIEGGYDLSPEEMLRYRRNLARETLRGEYVKSYGEKVIANFLFEHDIRYSYERAHSWGGRRYCPDFTLFTAGKPTKGIVIEYFGLAGDPDYDAEAQEKRDYWAARAGQWSFIELSPKDLAGDPARLAHRLETALRKEGVSCVRLSEDKIWERAQKRAIGRFTKLTKGFIGRCRKRWLLPDGLRDLLASHQALSDVESWFLELAVELYEEYLGRLGQTGDEDFDGLMQRAASLIESGQTKFARKSSNGDLRQLRYVFVDEYQDFSELFHRLISAIRRQNPGAALFCVGDDWQAINGFAGSDLKFYERFDKFVAPSERLYISTNYRSVRDVVDIGNALMLGRGKPARADKKSLGNVALVDLAAFRPTLRETERFKTALLTPVLLRLAWKALSEGKRVILLSRTNDLYDQDGSKLSLDGYLSKLRRFLPQHRRDQIAISTAHSFKGNQSDVVIVMDALERSYPLIHPDWVFARVLGESLDSIVDENRRLFYVALTRAKERLFVVTERGRESPFLDQIRSAFPLTKESLDDYPPPPDETERLIVKVSGSYDAMVKIKALLGADHFQYRGGDSKSWERSFEREGFSVESLETTIWAVEARNTALSGVKVAIHDDLDRLLAVHEFVNGLLMGSAPRPQSSVPQESL